MNSAAHAMFIDHQPILKIKVFEHDLKIGVIFRNSGLSGSKPKLNEELNIHDKGVATKEIEDLGMEGFMPSIPEAEFFSNEDICIISKEEAAIIDQMNKVEDEA